jgi:dipeptidyl aminopeptidase/acylaminoacyl peptidase
MRAKTYLKLFLFSAWLLLSACAPVATTPGDLSPSKVSNTMSKTSAPYGSWPSPITAASLAQASVSMSDLRTHAGAIFWRESRPAEGGRQVLMRRYANGAVDALTPAGFNVRTRVHEYGGNAYLVTDRGVVFANFADQRLYSQAFPEPTDSGANAPVAVTEVGFQFADAVLDARHQRMIWVREDHRAATMAANKGEERNEIVSLALPGSAIADAQILVTGSDFVASPSVSPDGMLAWVEWNHPHMPWERTRLKQAKLNATGLDVAATLLDTESVAALEPNYAADGTLYFVADHAALGEPRAIADWWNLQRWQDGAVQSVSTMPREFAGPMWNLGVSSYVLTNDGRAVVRSTKNAIDALGVIDLSTGRYQAFDLPFVAFSEVQLLDAEHAVALAQASDDTGVLIEITLASGVWRVLHQPTQNTLPAQYLARAEAIEFATVAGADKRPRKAHAWYYPPTHATLQGNEAELPPLIVTIHGGPTSVARSTLNLARQYWTTRGFAVVDVNYGGSTSYGRAYRERLQGEWGVVDVNDAIAAVDFLIAAGKVDANRVAIRGGSAGGFTTLAALAFHDRFKAGANLYGVADIAALAATSHKFERHYDVSLVGPPNAERYRARSPLYHLEGFTEPLITLQGSEDKVVPPAQSRAIVAALDQRGVPHAYIEFEGEQHGFRKSENIIRAQEAELYFYGQIFGFKPADTITPMEIKHWPRGAASKPE